MMLIEILILLLFGLILTIYISIFYFYQHTKRKILNQLHKTKKNDKRKRKTTGISSTSNAG
jgi:uncharacterized protein YxeA